MKEFVVSALKGYNARGMRVRSTTAVEAVTEGTRECDDSPDIEGTKLRRIMSDTFRSIDGLRERDRARSNFDSIFDVVDRQRTTWSPFQSHLRWLGSL